MRRRFGIRPSPTISAFAAVLGGGMTVFGVVMLVKTGHPFLILWTLVAAGITIYHAYNAWTGKAPALEVVDDERDSETTPDRTAASAAERLRELEQLRDQGLISEAEFAQKRRQVLDDL